MPITTTHLPATIWMADGIPARMVFAGRRWTVTDMPTRLRDSIWSAAAGGSRGLYGWRFQATDEQSSKRNLPSCCDLPHGRRIHHPQLTTA